MRNTRDERLRDSITASFRRCFDTVLKENAYPAYISGLFGHCSGDNVGKLASQFSMSEFRNDPGVDQYLLAESIKSYYLEYAHAPVVASLYFIAQPTPMDRLVESLDAGIDGLLHFLNQPPEGCAVQWNWIGFE